MKIIKIVLMVLILIMAVLIFVNRNKSEIPEKTIILKYKDKTVQVSYNIIKKMHQYDITDSKGKNYSGVKLQDLLHTVTKNRINKIELFSKDGMKISLDASEVNKAYLVHQQKNNEEYYRLAIPSDEFKQRWLKYISKIVVN